MDGGISRPVLHDGHAMGRGFTAAGYKWSKRGELNRGVVDWRLYRGRFRTRVLGFHSKEPR